MMNEGYRLCSGCNREIMVSSRGLFLPHKNKKKKIANPDNKTRYCSEDCEKRDSRRSLMPVNQEISKRKIKALKFSNPLYFD